MTDELLNCIYAASGPQTAMELRDAMRRNGKRWEEFQITQELRKLQAQGLVRLDGTRWRLLKQPLGLKLPAQTQGMAPRHGQRLPDSVETRLMAQDFAGPSAPSTSLGRWSLFRSLCRYYMDCLLQDEAPQLRAYVENENDTWIAVHQVPWGRLANEQGFAVSLGRDQSKFVRNRNGRGEDQCVYVCYPIKLIKSKEMRPGKDNLGFVVPLFAQPMKADWRRGVLHLQPDGPVAVNGAWLEYAFKRRDERAGFLRAIGLLSDVGHDDDSAGGNPTGPMDFAHLAQDAAHFLHDPDKFAQHVEPMNLSVVADWEDAQPGLYNVAILTLGPRLRYTRSLMRDLREISTAFSDEDLDRTALASVFPHVAPQVESFSPKAEGFRNEADAALRPPDGLAQTRLLHQAQRDAVMNALLRRVSVVTGPPGTGKSEVVAGMLLNQLLHGRPTLFASKNHQALEAVLPRLNNAVEGGDLIIQTSGKDLAQRQNYLRKLQDLLARPPRPDVGQGAEYRERLTTLFKIQGLALDELSALEQARAEYEAVNNQLESARTKLPHHLRPDNVIATWPAGITPGRITDLKRELANALLRPTRWYSKLWRLVCRHSLAARSNAVQAVLHTLPPPYPGRSLPSAESPAETWSEFFILWEVWAEAAHLLGQVRCCEQRLAQLPPVDDCNQRLANAQDGIERTTARWMQWAAGGVPNALGPMEREALDNLRAGIQNWGATKFAQALKRNFPLILQAFPLWSSSNLSVRSALPLIPALFDLVIIDEASQCDIPSIVPLLARARRLVVVGDPMQLQHVSSLDAAVDQALQEQHGLSHAQVQRFTCRVNSAFGLADANPSVSDGGRVRLDLHFRSHDLIADYCNEAFYHKTLHVVTVTEQLKIPKGVRPGIHWTDVRGALEAGTTGAWCADEITAVHEELQKLVSIGYEGTIGVVTPFRQQMIRLKDSLEGSDAMPRDFKERVRFLVATAHGFQGDERDLILFSLCGGAEMPPGAAAFLRENPNLFNVAVSRARAVLHVVGNHGWAQQCGISFIEKLAARASRADKTASPPESEPYQSPWEKVLAEALQAAGVQVAPQYPIAGRFLDLGILQPRKIDVEVDGEAFHRTAGGGRKDDDHWRDLQLKSLGWDVCRFWVYELRDDLSKCVQKVLGRLQ